MEDFCANIESNPVDVFWVCLRPPRHVFNNAGDETESQVSEISGQKGCKDHQNGFGNMAVITISNA